MVVLGGQHDTGTWSMGRADRKKGFVSGEVDLACPGTSVPHISWLIVGQTST